MIRACYEMLVAASRACRQGMGQRSGLKSCDAGCPCRYMPLTQPGPRATRLTASLACISQHPAAQPWTCTLSAHRQMSPSARRSFSPALRASRVLGGSTAEPQPLWCPQWWEAFWLSFCLAAWPWVLQRKALRLNPSTEQPAAHWITLSVAAASIAINQAERTHSRVTSCAPPRCVIDDILAASFSAVTF